MIAFLGVALAIGIGERSWWKGGLRGWAWRPCSASWSPSSPSRAREYPSWTSCWARACGVGPGRRSATPSAWRAAHGGLRLDVRGPHAVGHATSQLALMRGMVLAGRSAAPPSPGGPAAGLPLLGVRDGLYPVLSALAGLEGHLQCVPGGCPGLSPGRARAARASQLPCSRRGLPMPRASRTARWALTPPFHPYPLARAVIFCGTVRRRGLWSPPPRLSTGVVLDGVRKFLPPFGERPPGRP